MYHRCAKIWQTRWEGIGVNCGGWMEKWRVKLQVCMGNKRLPGRHNTELESHNYSEVTTADLHSSWRNSLLPLFQISACSTASRFSSNSRRKTQFSPNNFAGKWVLRRIGKIFSRWSMWLQQIQGSGYRWNRLWRRVLWVTVLDCQYPSMLQSAKRKAHTITFAKLLSKITFSDDTTKCWGQGRHNCSLTSTEAKLASWRWEALSSWSPITSSKFVWKQNLFRKTVGSDGRSLQISDNCQTANWIFNFFCKTDALSSIWAASGYV